jgi:Zn-dependent peptidase ImmA (M78 family)/transcriptional regulator with XRE-family HTH domain
MPKVNPNILRWARDTAGLSLDQAAAKLGLSGSARLEALEQGEVDPSRRQLVLMSEKYHRPLLTFYLPKPPRPSNKGRDFRTLPEGQAPGSEALLDALLRDVLARQGLVAAALEEAEEDQPLAFVGSRRMGDGIARLVDSMREVLGVSLAEFRRQRTATDAFKVLRAGAEKAGVFVLLLGNLGTHHTDIDARVFRGFALADPIAPFVVVNEKDSRAAWSFTLLHELAHVWLGETGVSGYDGQAKIERFCDEVAARYLLDPAELVGVRTHEAVNLDDLKARISEFAGPRKLSRKMVAYNLLRSNLITATKYRSLSDEFDAERARKPDHGGGGSPDYYTVRRHRVGPGLVELVRRMMAGGALSTTKAGRVLGVKPTAVDRLVGGGHAA